MVTQTVLTFYYLINIINKPFKCYYYLYIGILNNLTLIFKYQWFRLYRNKDFEF
jgi:hypothetical protein